MTIQKLDPKRVLISLKNEDINTYEININKLNINDESSKKALKTLLYQVCLKTGISTSDKSILVEAMPYKEGLLILITVDDIKKLRKTYKIKRPLTLPCFQFSNADSMLSCINKLAGFERALPKNSLWLYKECYCLVFEISPPSAKAQIVLTEFSTCLNISRINLARIKENGKLLSGNNAVANILSSI